MMTKSIPAGSVEIQTGLWAAEVHYTFNGKARMRYNLYSAEGYCFWNVGQPENYGENGELLPMEQRTYAQFAITACRTIDALNENYVSVPLMDGYENVSATNTTES